MSMIFLSTLGFSCGRGTSRMLSSCFWSGTYRVPENHAQAETWLSNGPLPCLVGGNGDNAQDARRRIAAGQVLALPSARTPTRRSERYGAKRRRARERRWGTVMVRNRRASKAVGATGRGCVGRRIIRW